MNRYVKSIVLGIVWFVLGSAVTRYYDTHRLTALPVVDTAKPTDDKGAIDFASIDYAHQPLWAYGFDRPPAPGEVDPERCPSANRRAGTARSASVVT